MGRLGREDLAAQGSNALATPILQSVAVRDHEGNALLAAARVGSVEALGRLLGRQIWWLARFPKIESLRQRASGRCLPSDRPGVYSRSEVGAG